MNVTTSAYRMKCKMAKYLNSPLFNMKSFGKSKFDIVLEYGSKYINTFDFTGWGVVLMMFGALGNDGGNVIVLAFT